MTLITRLLRRLRHKDDGFTLVELMTTVFLLGIVMATIYGAIASFQKTTSVANTKTLTNDDVRTAVETIARDLRAANPIDPVSPSSLYNTQVQFDVFCSSAGSGTCGSNNLHNVKYQVSNNKLVRTDGSTNKVLLGPNGATGYAVALRPGAIVNSASQPIFTYLDKNGAAISTSTNTGAHFRDCTKAVQIHLVVIQQPGQTSNPLDFTTKVEIRNYNEVSGC
jgi:prepilin-type N-terminal cleavage/methylation domain-containing protein